MKKKKLKVNLNIQIKVKIKRRIINPIRKKIKTRMIRIIQFQKSYQFKRLAFNK